MSAQTPFQAQANVEELKTKALVNGIINNMVTDATKKLFKPNLGSVVEVSKQAPNPVNSNDQGQNDLKASENTHFQSDKCLSKVIGNPTSIIGPPIPTSTISKNTLKMKGTKRDRNRTMLVGLNQFLKQKAAQETVAPNN